MEGSELICCGNMTLTEKSLRRVYCGHNKGDVDDFMRWANDENCESIKKGEFIAVYGEIKSCCLEDEARDLNLPEMPKRDGGK